MIYIIKLKEYLRDGLADGHKPDLLGAFTGQSRSGDGAMIPRLRVALRVPKPGDLGFCRALLASWWDEGTMRASIINMRAKVRERAGVTGVPRSWAPHPHHSIGHTGVEQAQGRVRHQGQSRVQGCSFIAALPVTPAYQQAYPNRHRVEPAHRSRGWSISHCQDRPKNRDGHPSFSSI